jgi:hypothetical protein
MSTRRLTVSVPEATAKKLKRAAVGRSVSSWVTELIEEKLDESGLEQEWRALYAEVDPTPADKKRADAIFAELVRPRRRRVG